MIAALPMYDRPETRAANDRFWALIHAHLGDGPDTLTREGDLWDIWQSPDLLLAQTCGYPYRARLHGRVTLVGTPDYGLPGCPPGHYNSALVVRAEETRDQLTDFATATLAYNEPLSQSGWAAPQTDAAGAGFTFTHLLQTGAHIASARAVADGRADIAAIDALTWRMICRYDGFAANLRVLHHTTPTPALPYITALGGPRDVLFTAMEATIAALDDPTRDTLSLRGLCDLPSEAYLKVPTPPGP